MKHLKKLGLLGLAMTAILAVFAGNASATELTSPSGIVYSGPIKAEDENGIFFEGPLQASCGNSTWEAEIEGQGPSVTVSGKLKNLTFSDCGNTTISVTDSGTFEMHTEAEGANGNGVMTSTGMTITTQFHVNLLGFPWTLHCITETNETTIGSILGSKNNSGKTARIGTLRIKDPTDAACSEEVEWTGFYSITKPDYLDVD